MQESVPIGRQPAGLPNPATKQVIVAVQDVPLDLTRPTTSPSSYASFICNGPAATMAVG